MYRGRHKKIWPSKFKRENRLGMNFRDSVMQLATAKPTKLEGQIFYFLFCAGLCMYVYKEIGYELVFVTAAAEKGNMWIDR